MSQNTGRAWSQLGQCWINQLPFATVSPGCEPCRADGTSCAAAEGQSPARTPLPAASAMVELAASLQCRLHTCNGVVVWASLQPWEHCLVDEALQVVEGLLACLGVHAAGTCKIGRTWSQGSRATLLSWAAFTPGHSEQAQCLFRSKSEPGLAQGSSPDSPRIFLPSLLPG